MKVDVLNEVVIGQPPDVVAAYAADRDTRRTGT